jgi:endoglucanase
MLIKKLTDANGLPGFEKEVREIIRAELAGHADSVTTDRLGNLIAVKNPNAAGRHVVLCAHMDEVGLCIKSIDKDGYLRFESWGVDARVLYTKSVIVGKDRLPGVIGAAPIHLLPPERRTEPVPVDKLYIDIGAKNKEDAEKYVSPGDFAAFVSEYTEFGEHKIKAKALDDRVGCAAVIEVFKSDIKQKVTGVFTVQEEAGLRGAAVAANRVEADIAVIIEGTVCADTAEPDERQVTVQGQGPVISMADSSSLYPKKHIDAVTGIAKAHGIPFQFKRLAVGGTDAGRFHQAKGGMPCIGLAAPCRYIHSPVSVIDMRDYENLVKLVKLYIEHGGE